jgi:hypothetical protein
MEIQELPGTSPLRSQSRLCPRSTGSLKAAPGLLNPTPVVYFLYLRTDDTNKKIDAWIDVYFLAYFHCKLYK